MYEDDPQEKVFDVLGEAVFGDHPLGRAIIGRAPVIADTPVRRSRAFTPSRYVPSNIVIAAAGAVDHDALVALAAERVAAAAIRRPALAPAPCTRAASRRGGASSARTPSSTTSASAGPALSRHDDRRFALRVLDTIFGGTSSSRLFQEVRERRGLAYAVYSFTSAYQDTGQVGLYVGTRADNLTEALAVVGTELARLREQPATDEELARAKENLKGRVVLALESTGARMNRLGSEMLAGAPLLSLDEVVERIDAVSHEDLAALVDELWAPGRLSAAGIGPDEEQFDEALAAIEPGLVSEEVVA